MADEKKESSLTVEDLPPAEKELTAEEQRQIKGGSAPGATDSPFINQPILKGQVIYQNTVEPSGSKE